MESIRKFNQKDIVGIIQDLEYIRINLTRIGKLAISQDPEKAIFIQGLFLADEDVQKKFYNVWRVLVDNFKGGEEDDLDDLLETIEHWELPVGISKEELFESWKDKAKRSFQRNEL